MLELGGSDPYLILEDADLESAVETCVASRLVNGGQSCIAAKRFVIVDAAARRVRAAVRRADARRGRWAIRSPRASTSARWRGATCATRSTSRSSAASPRARSSCWAASVPPGPGAFYPPTVLDDVRPGMPAYDEEIFGPVAALIFVPDEDEAIRVANDSPFGLGAAVFTRDARARRGDRGARASSAGSCFVNAFVRSDPRLPFGGIKESGYGRELGPFGIREFVNIKTVYVR